eukprot:jgi/Psemu1/58071/gm1.58071_g
MKLLKTYKDTIEGQVRAYVKKKWYDTIIKHWLEKIGLVSDGVIVESSGNYGTFDILQYVPMTDIQLTQPYYDIILPFDDITAVDSEMAKVPASFPGTVALNTDSMEILAKEYRRYGNAANEEFYYFVTRILSAINPGKTNFRLRKTKDLISTIFTVTDEAFALMIIDNDGSANGWDKEERKVFTKLCKKIQTLRENPETGINLEKMMLQRFDSESNPSSTVSNNGGTVASSLAEEESEDENYIDPARRQLLDEMEEGKLSRGKKRKQTPDLHNWIVPPGWKSGSTWFSHSKLGGVTDGWFLVEWANQIGNKPINFIFTSSESNYTAPDPKEDKDIPPAPEPQGHVDPRLSPCWSCMVPGERPNPNWLNLSWGRATELTATISTSYKATKSDVGAVHKHLWNEKIVEVLSQEWGDQSEPSLDFSKPGDLLCFKWALRKLQSFCLMLWKKKFGGTSPNACAKADSCSWWTWDKGSPIFFWCGKALVKEKLSVVIDKGYIELADIKFVEAMMFMSHAPKGEMDVHIVYDSTKSGLNNTLYALWFAFPTVDSMVQWVVAGMWLADNDNGKQFLSFLLHSDLRKYYGVHLSQLVASAPNEPGAMGVWMQNVMGLKSSPYNSVQRLLRAKHIVLGDPQDPCNLYAQDWYMAAIQITAPTEDLAWKCSNKMAKGLCGMVSTKSGQDCKSVTKQRWIKLQDQICWIALQANMCDKDTKAGYPDLEAKSEKNGNYKNSIPPNGDPPIWVIMVSQFKAYVIALMELSFADDPPRNPARVCNKEACYVVGDASGSGFGSSTRESKERKIHAEFSAWSEKRKVGSGTIPRGSEVFVFTDNFVAESTMLKGTDGLSRGDFTSGVMMGEAFLKGQLTWKFTSPNDWFHKVNQGSLYIKRMITKIQCCNIFTSSDEAFALLFLYNDYKSWLNTTKGTRNDKGQELYTYVKNKEDKENRKEQRQEQKYDMMKTLDKDDDNCKYYIKHVKNLLK